MGIIQTMRQKAMHVYCPGRPSLDRPEFIRLMWKRDWEVNCLDPKDRRPRGKGLLMDDLLVGRRPGNLRNHEILQVSQFPFDAEEILLKTEDLKGTFGVRGVRILKNARLLHAFNGKDTTKVDAVQFVFDVAQAVAKAEGGKCYDCKAVRFL
jgi:hypothetical protein